MIKTSRNILLIANPESIHDQKRIACLADHGYRCHVVPIDYQNKKIGSAQSKTKYNENIIIHLPVSPFSLPRVYRTMQAIRQLSKLIRKEKIELFVVIYLEPGALWALLCPFLKIPYILFSCGTDVLKTIPFFFEKRNFQSRYSSLFYKKVFQKADHIIGTSKSQVDSIVEMAGNKGLRSQPVIIRTGVDINKIKGRNYTQPIPELKDKKYVFFPRSVAPLYNHEFCLRAIALMPEGVRNNSSFIFVNMYAKDEDYINHIKEIIAGTNASILFLTGQSQEAMFGLYQHAALVVMTPFSDGSPVSAMEAMAFSRPLILGPIQYDADLFSWPVLKLKNWDENELAGLMGSVLKNEMNLPLEQLNERAMNLCDKEKEMQKLKNIIGDLLD